jgi:NAD(P)-dependent dehydrogenase (short-subunit alcohol dehydrogenase family)
MGQLEGKVILLTGASMGLGKQQAIYLAGTGAKLSICARRYEKLQETAKLCEEAGGEVLAVQCDVSEPDQLAALVRQTVERFGTIDVLINNANAQAPMMPFMEQDDSELERAFKTGVFSYWRLMHLCYPYLKGKSSSVINFVSGVYEEGYAWMAAYTADKGAIRALSMTVAREWGKDGIRCNTIAPVAMTDTIYSALPPEQKERTLTDAKDCPLGRLGDPYSDIAPVVAFLASDDSHWITGQNFNVDGGKVIYS